MLACSGSTWIILMGGAAWTTRTKRMGALKAHNSFKVAWEMLRLIGQISKKGYYHRKLASLRWRSRRCLRGCRERLSTQEVEIGRPVTRIGIKGGGHILGQISIRSPATDTPTPQLKPISNARLRARRLRIRRMGVRTVVVLAWLTTPPTPPCTNPKNATTKPWGFKKVAIKAGGREVTEVVKAVGRYLGSSLLTTSASEFQLRWWVIKWFTLRETINYKCKTITKCSRRLRMGAIIIFRK